MRKKGNDDTLDTVYVTDAERRRLLRVEAPTALGAFWTVSQDGEWLATAACVWFDSKTNWKKQHASPEMDRKNFLVVTRLIENTPHWIIPYAELFEALSDRAEYGKILWMQFSTDARFLYVAYNREESRTFQDDSSGIARLDLSARKLQRDFYVIDSGRAFVPSGLLAFAVSPDESTVLTLERRAGTVDKLDLFLASLVRRSKRRVAVPTEHCCNLWPVFAWFPDSRHFLLIENAPGTPARVLKVSAIDLRAEIVYQTRSACPSSGEILIGYQAAVAPNGEHVVISEKEKGVVMVSTKTREESVLFQPWNDEKLRSSPFVQMPCWSPNSKFLAFSVTTAAVKTGAVGHKLVLCNLESRKSDVLGSFEHVAPAYLVGRKAAMERFLQNAELYEQ